jgi:hypothetical protein
VRDPTAFTSGSLGRPPSQPDELMGHCIGVSFSENDPKAQLARTDIAVWPGAHPRLAAAAFVPGAKLAAREGSKCGAIAVETLHSRFDPSHTSAPANEEPCKMTLDMDFQ